MKSLLCVVLLIVVATANGRNRSKHSSIAEELQKSDFISRERNPKDDSDEECTTPWRTIDGHCYLFSRDVGASPQSQGSAENYCSQNNGAHLACAGQESASDADPLLEFIHEKGWTNIWVGATFNKVDSTWKWEDGRKLSVGSNMWYPYQPRGEGACVEVINIRRGHRAYLNDLSCSAPRAFVCEKVHEDEHEDDH